MEGRTFVAILLLLVVCVHTGRSSNSTQIRHQEKRVRSASDWNKYRLPTNVCPTHYELKLKPLIYEGRKEDFSFEGSVTIYLECTEVTDVIVLHKDSLDINRSNVSVTKEGDQTNLFKRFSERPRRHFLRLHLSQHLEVRQRYVLKIEQFSGPLSTDGYGLYLSHYNDGNDEVCLVTSQLEAVYARKAFPCFDEPQLKATFDVTLVRRSDTGRDYFSLSNTRRLSSTNINSGPWVEDRFETTPTMPTYLLAFVICDFEMVENYSSTHPSVLYRTFAPRTVIQTARRAHEIGLEVFNRINGIFQPKYSQALTKLDNVWVPHFNFGAMENWGLIIITIDALNGIDDAPRMEMQLFSLITHELAHQWFGNFVSPKWWKWAWLNEGFAYWWQNYITEQVFPHLHMTHDWLNFDLQTEMETDAQRTTHPLETEPQEPNDIMINFDTLSNVKGTALVRMMQFIMGTNTFIGSLNNYLTTYQYGNADSADLFTILDETMKSEGYGDSFMTTKMTSWVSEPGFPVVEVQKTTNGYRLSQKRYLIQSEEHNSSWEIPITYATLEDPNMNKSRSDIVWLSGQATLEINDASYSWILVNIDQIAYCRVFYDRDTWDALIGQLNHNHTVISVINRAQLINDAWTFATDQKLDLSVALRTLNFLQSELELLPWLSLQYWTGYMEMNLQTSDLYEKFQNYMRNLVKYPIERLTLDISNDMSPTDVQLRVTLATYACKYGLPACVEKATVFFNEWKQTGVFRSHSTLRNLYFCTAVADSDDNWQYALTQYTSSNISDDNKPPLSALGCSANPVKLNEFLRKCLSGTEGIERFETPLCVEALSSSAARQVALEFLLASSSELQRYFAEFIRTMLYHVTEPFYSTEFFNDHLPRLREVFTNAHTQLASVEVWARKRSDWMETNKAAIRTWLNDS